MSSFPYRLDRIEKDGSKKIISIIYFFYNMNVDKKKFMKTSDEYYDD